MSVDQGVTEFGDFQTPGHLAGRVVDLLIFNGVAPDVIVEPTCGLGSFIRAARKAYPKTTVHAFDVNPEYVQQAQREYGDRERKISIKEQDFFTADWKAFFKNLHGNILVLGNPPWVTNSSLGSLGSTNLPQKSNFQNHQGFAAKTGKANFDISEWMLIRLVEALGNRQAHLAMLCKTATASVVFHN